MTLSTTASRVRYVGTGTTGPFAVPFRFVADEDLLVTVRDADTDAETELVLTVDYTVSGAGNATGSVTLVSALATDDILVIRRVPDAVQSASFAGQGQYRGSSHEAALDAIVMQMQRLIDGLDRSFKLSETYDPGGFSLTVKPETGKVLAWQSATELGNSTLDSSSVALPGEGRSVATLSAYLMNNAVYNVKDYLAAGDGVTDDTAAILDAEAARPEGSRLYFPPGTYLIDGAYNGGVLARANLLRVLKSGEWDFSAATIKYGSSSALTTGSDGGGMGVINVCADNVTLRGTIDGNNLARYAVALKSASFGAKFDIDIQNLSETSGRWSGLITRCSADVLEAAPFTTTAMGTSGFLRRSQCPMIDPTGAITDHVDIAAVLVGGGVSVSATSGAALVGMSNGYSFGLVRIDLLGVPANIKPSAANDYFMDFVAHDIGSNSQEIYGHAPETSKHNGFLTGSIIGQLIKLAAKSGWFYNDPADGTNVPPNVEITGGTAQGTGMIDLDPEDGTGGARIIDKIAPLTDAATIAVDAALGNMFSVTITANRTVGAPTNLRKGQRLTFIVTQDGTGGWTLGWNAVFRQGWVDTNNTANRTSVITFICYDGVNLIQFGGQRTYLA